jgi:hypothetical protein
MLAERIRGSWEVDPAGDVGESVAAAGDWMGGSFVGGGEEGF